MMRRSTDALIATLAADLTPVRPLPSPLWRAAGLLALVIGMAAVAIVASPDALDVLATHAARPQWLALEMPAVVLTGLIATLAAFMLSVPGRSRGWLLAPLVPLTVWLGTAGWGCYLNALTGADPTDPPSLKCLAVLIGASLVLAPPVLWSLSRARPLDPVAVAVPAGFGVAAFAALILYFFHPHAVTAFDLAAHLLGVGLVVGTVVLARRRLFAPV